MKQSFLFLFLISIVNLGSAKAQSGIVCGVPVRFIKLYNLEGLLLDSNSFYNLKLDPSQIRRSRMFYKHDTRDYLSVYTVPYTPITIYVDTEIMTVKLKACVEVNGILISNARERRKILSIVQQKKISIENFLPADKTYKGHPCKYGVLKIAFK